MDHCASSNLCFSANLPPFRADITRQKTVFDKFYSLQNHTLHSARKANAATLVVATLHRAALCQYLVRSNKPTEIEQSFSFGFEQIVKRFTACKIRYYIQLEKQMIKLHFASILSGQNCNLKVNLDELNDIVNYQTLNF